MEYPSTLPFTYKQALKRGQIRSLVDLFSKNPSEISKKCRLAPSDINIIIDLWCKQIAVAPRTLEEVLKEGADQKFTTGDEIIDRVLGGGIRTGTVWEFVGESAAGKTQLALQLSLLVQLPRTLGGVSGSACYLTVQGVLETRRIVTICDAHPLLSPTVCTLDDIQTVKAPTIQLLQKVLKEQLPQLIKSRVEDLSKRPVKLLVIDSIADLFPSLEKMSASTLAERSKSLAEISALLHRTARQHQIAVVVLNRVGDVFANDGWSEDANTGALGDLVYRDQSRWFSRADSIHEERSKEAALGLVWANQVNVRIMFTRTTRRRYLEEVGGPATKRRRGETSTTQTGRAPSLEQDTTLLRRMTVIFSSVSVPGSIDFILTDAGLSAPLEIQTNVPPPPALPTQRPPNTLRREDSLAEVAPLDVGSAEAAAEASLEKDVDEDDALWDAWTKEDEEFYQGLDLSMQ